MHRHTRNTTPFESAYDFELISFMERSGQIEPHEAEFMRAYMRNKIAM